MQNPPNNNDTPVEITPQTIQQDAAKLFNMQKSAINNGILIAKTANEWMAIARNTPIPKMLFSEFWHQGEACILFADTNLGKSILAVQIADSISRGIAIPGFKLEADAQPVLYLDFELSAKQYQNRYSEGYTNDYVFSDNFIRVEADLGMQLPEGLTFEECLERSIEQQIITRNIRVLIIDNLTYLQPETERTREAWELMNLFKRLRNTYGLSILALAHTPKRDPSKPIVANNIQGSKNMANFCDSAFSIGQSAKDEGLRYIKQIKQRATEQVYGKERVCTCMIEKRGNFLQYVFLHTGDEAEHLKETSAEERAALEANVLKLHKKGLSLRQIGKELNISHTKADRIVKKCNGL